MAWQAALDDEDLEEAEWAYDEGQAFDLQTEKQTGTVAEEESESFQKSRDEGSAPAKTLDTGVRDEQGNQRARVVEQAERRDAIDQVRSKREGTCERKHEPTNERKRNPPPESKERRDDTSMITS